MTTGITKGTHLAMLIQEINRAVEQNTYTPDRPTPRAAERTGPHEAADSRPQRRSPPDHPTTPSRNR